MEWDDCLVFSARTLTISLMIAFSVLIYTANDFSLVVYFILILLTLLLIFFFLFRNGTKILTSYLFISLIFSSYFIIRIIDAFSKILL